MNYNELPLSSIEQNKNLKSKLAEIKYTEENDYEEELIMYNIIFPYLKLGKGKLVSQVSHGIQQAVEYLVKYDEKLYERYTQDCIKITLKINTKEELSDFLNKTIDLKKILVIDKGRTQCEPNTLTCVTFLPLRRKNVPDEILKLNLY